MFKKTPKHINEATDDELLHLVAALLEWRHVGYLKRTYEMAAKEVGVNIEWEKILEKRTLNAKLPSPVRHELRKAYCFLNSQTKR